MIVQPDDALRNHGYVSDLQPHMKVSWAWFEKVGSEIGHIWAKKASFACSVNEAF